MRHLRSELFDLACAPFSRSSYLCFASRSASTYAAVRGRGPAPTLVAERDVELRADRGIGLLALLERGARERVLLRREVAAAVVEQLVGAPLLSASCGRGDRRAYARDEATSLIAPIVSLLHEHAAGARRHRDVDRAVGLAP